MDRAESVGAAASRFQRYEVFQQTLKAANTMKLPEQEQTQRAMQVILRCLQGVHCCSPEIGQSAFMRTLSLTVLDSSDSV